MVIAESKMFFILILVDFSRNELSTTNFGRDKIDIIQGFIVKFCEKLMKKKKNMIT